MAWWLHFKLENLDSEDLPEKTTLDVDITMDDAEDVAEYDVEDVAKDVAEVFTEYGDTKFTGRNLS